MHEADEYLVKVDRRITEAEARLARQRRAVLRLAVTGQREAGAKAEDLVRMMEQALTVLRQQRVLATKTGQPPTTSSTLTPGAAS